jgi:DNA-directed RNA polymerase subunit RPC12/RpoP
MNKCPKCGNSGKDFTKPNYILTDDNMEWLYIKCRECGYMIDRMRPLDFNESYGRNETEDMFPE